MICVDVEAAWSCHDTWRKRKDSSVKSASRDHTVVVRPAQSSGFLDIASQPASQRASQPASPESNS